MTTGGARIEAALSRAIEAGRPAIAPFLTAGYPDRARFSTCLRSAAGAADVVEIGVPFSDPVADGLTIQRASGAALRGGMTLASLLAELYSARLDTPVVLMSYVNPLLAYGKHRFADDAAAAGVHGVIVPDLPLEEQDLLAPELRAASIALVQLVAPTTPPERARRLALASEGFVYAIAVTGTTGIAAGDLNPLRHAIAKLKSACATPVLAGFGIRDRSHVASIVPPADGVVIGSALVEAIDAGIDPAAFLAERLR